MQFVAAGSTVQRPELMVKNCCALVKPTIMSRKAPHVPPMQGRPEGYSIFVLQRERVPVQYPPNKFGAPLLDTVPGSALVTTINETGRQC